MGTHRKPTAPGAAGKRLAICITTALGAAALGLSATTAQAAGPNVQQNSVLAQRPGQTPQDDGSHIRGERALAPQYDVEYTVPRETDGPEGYQSFIRKFREAVSTEIPGWHFRRPIDRTDPITVRLHAGDGPDAPQIDLLVRPRDLYVVGWRNQNHNYWLRDEAGNQPADMPEGFELARISGDYPNLEGSTYGAGRSRSEIELGRLQMYDAITTLADEHDRGVQAQAVAMIRLVQMIPEAARFDGIANLIARPDQGQAEYITWNQGGSPHPVITQLENKWKQTSMNVRAAMGYGTGAPYNPYLTYTQANGLERQITHLTGRDSLERVFTIGTIDLPERPRVGTQPGLPGGEPDGPDDQTCSPSPDTCPESPS